MLWKKQPPAKNVLSASQNPGKAPVQRHILIVDDDVHMVKMMKDALELEGYNVICCYDGVSSLTLCKAEGVALILLDFLMPMINGLEVIQQIRADPRSRTIPIILCTVVESLNVKLIAEKEDRVAYLKKPFNLDQLLELIDRWMKKQS